jgi:hypothetical protein
MDMGVPCQILMPLQVDPSIKVEQSVQIGSFKSKGQPESLQQIQLESQEIDLFNLTTA